MKRNHKFPKKKLEKAALENIKELLDDAAKVFKEDKALANRYVEHARKIAMKTKTKIPSQMQKKFCKHCYSFLVPSVNLRVRIKDSKMVYYCLECKKFMRFPYKRKKVKVQDQ